VTLVPSGANTKLPPPAPLNRNRHPHGHGLIIVVDDLRLGLHAAHRFPAGRAEVRDEAYQPFRPQADLRALNVYVDAFDQQLNDARLFDGEQLVSERIETVQTDQQPKLG
jgi:hypothetical protein